MTPLLIIAASSALAVALGCAACALGADASAADSAGGAAAADRVLVEDGKSATWVTTFDQVVTGADKKHKWIESEDRPLAYLPPGLYRDTFLDANGKQRGFTVTDTARKLELSVNLPEKQATLTEAAVLPKDPRGPFAWCYDELRNKDTKWVEKRQIAGREADIYRHTFWDASNGNNWSYDFGVDAQTKHLVEVRVPGLDIYDPDKDPDRKSAPEAKAWRKSGLGVVQHDIVFGAQLDASLFSMDPPEGYALTKVARPQITEKEMVDYLGVLADFNDKIFPDQVTPFAFSSERVNKVYAKRRAQRTPAEQALLDTQQHYMLVGLNAMPTGHFIEDHTAPGSFKYVGKGVKLGDGDHAVCWYQPKGEKFYRVVYGDLSIKELRAEELPKLPESAPAAR